MKHYRIRRNSPLWYALPWLAFTALIVLTGLGNHYIDGIY